MAKSTITPAYQYQARTFWDSSTKRDKAKTPGKWLPLPLTSIKWSMVVEGYVKIGLKKVSLDKPVEYDSMKLGGKKQGKNYTDSEVLRSCAVLLQVSNCKQATGKAGRQIGREVGRKMR